MNDISMLTSGSKKKAFDKQLSKAPSSSSMSLSRMRRHRMSRNARVAMSFLSNVPQFGDDDDDDDDDNDGEPITSRASSKSSLFNRFPWFGGLNDMHR